MFLNDIIKKKELKSEILILEERVLMLKKEINSLEESISKASDKLKSVEEVIKVKNKDLRTINKNLKDLKVKKEQKSSSKFLIDYFNETDFRKAERYLKKYNMEAYKKLLFDFYPRFRKGEFLGDLLSVDKKKGIEKYELNLPTNNLFFKVYGKVKLIYKVYKFQNVIVLNELEPKEILMNGDKRNLILYKGVMISKKDAQKEMFKIDLLSRLEDK